MPRQPDKKFIDAAQMIEKDFGIFTSITLAQFILESAWGEKSLKDVDTGEESYNYFGIKFNPAIDNAYVKSWTHEVIDGKKIKIKADFAKYKSIEDGFIARALLLCNNKRYKDVVNAKTPDDAARALQKGGYATSPSYAQDLIKLMNAQGLYKYDLRK